MNRGPWKELVRLALTVAGTVVIGQLALAGRQQAGGDALTPGRSKVYFGSVCAGETYTATVPVFLKHADGGWAPAGFGRGPVFAGAAAVDVATTGGLEATGGTIRLPGDWAAPGDGRVSEAVTSLITLVPAGAPGPYVAPLTYRATGAGDDGRPVTMEATLAAYWTLVACLPRDTTPPAIVPAIAGTRGDNGWYTSAVTVTWAVEDPESAVAATAGCGRSTLADTPGAVLTCTATNSAGLASSRSVALQVDRTPPRITILQPRPGDTYLLNQVVAVEYEASDAGSGLAGASPALPAYVDTGAVGSWALGVTAADRAGNRATVASPPYQVIYVIKPLLGEGKAWAVGATVPVALQLVDAQGENVSDPRIAVHAVGLEKMADRAEGALAEGSGDPPDADFCYDAALGAYVYHLSTRGLTRGTWKLSLAVDGVAHGTYRVNLVLR